MTREMPILTPRQALERLIRADERKLSTWGAAQDRYKIGRLPYIVADAAVRFEEARLLGDVELLRAAQQNLSHAVVLWRVYSRG